MESANIAAACAVVNLDIRMGYMNNESLFMATATTITKQFGNCSGVHCPHCPLYKLNQPKKAMQGKTYCKAGGVGKYFDIIRELQKWVDSQIDKRNKKDNMLKWFLLFLFIASIPTIAAAIWYFLFGPLK